MMMRILLITNHPCGETGIEIEPGRAVSAVSQQNGLAQFVTGRVYDLIFVDEELTLTEGEFTMCAQALAPWGSMVTFHGFRSNRATSASN